MLQGKPLDFQSSPGQNVLDNNIKILFNLAIYFVEMTKTKKNKSHLFKETI